LIGWAGDATNSSAPLKGSLKCARATTDIKGEKVTVNLELKEETCSESFFTSSGYISGTSLKPLRLVDCKTILGKTANDNCDGAEKGTSKSFLIHLLMYPLMPQALLGQVDLKNSNRLSRCIDANSVSSQTATDLLIPFGGSGFRPSILIETMDKACADSSSKKNNEYFFPLGFDNKFLSSSRTASFSSSDFGDVFLATKFSFESFSLRSCRKFCD
jgi:hypothetical protein